MNMASSGDVATIDAMLRGLTSRPNVQSTLILSRKDGSIIKAAGLISPDEQKRNETSSYRHSSSKKDIDQTLDTTTQASSVNDQSPNEPEPRYSSELETLARAVYQFVGVAGTLGRSLSAFDDDAEKLSGRDGQDEKTEKTDQPEKSTSSGGQQDNEVQLLRMRIKRQEVIIFPDPNYLCCVVQSMDKAAK